VCKSNSGAPVVRRPKLLLRRIWFQQMIPENENTLATWQITTTKLISYLRPAKAILLFGPGEAKGELRKRLERNKLDVRITRCETSDKMTERQILQKVRRHYLPPPQHCALADEASDDYESDQENFLNQIHICISNTSRTCFLSSPTAWRL
jgi:hypothetical protein